ncbi:MAG: helix-turn-helix transcriptional regulator [Chloroflexi bacterium]|nr:helix-turn-helix transcriptional regulator [Chloroflexota bacterium]MBU1662001.1 helix-turn-helix transcriptional regulator [Chloroflexota bacterium]
MKLEEYRKGLQQDPEYLAVEKELKPLLNLADDVLELRLEREWSQSELARRAGTQQSNISRIESGLGNPTFKFIQKLANTFDAEIVIRLQVPEIARPFISATEQPCNSHDGENSIYVPNWPQRSRNQITNWNDLTATPTELEEGIPL